MKTQEKEKKEESLFNAGISKLDRINYLKMGIVDSKLKGDFNRRSELLSSLFTEIYERLSEKEREQCFIYEKQMRYVTNKMSSTVRFDRTLLAIFDTFERYLVTLEFSYGMSLPNKISDGEVVGS